MGTRISAARRRLQPRYFSSVNAPTITRAPSHQLGLQVAKSLNISSSAQDTLLNLDNLRETIEAAEVGLWQWDRQLGQFSFGGRSKVLLGCPDVEALPVDRFLDLFDLSDRANVGRALEANSLPSGYLDVDFQTASPDAEA